MTMRSRLGLVVTLGVLAAGAAGADESHYLFPTGLAARVESGDRGGLVVGIEPRSDGTLVTVSSLAQTLDEWPAPTARNPRLDSKPASLLLQPRFQLPAELGGLLTTPVDSWRNLVRVVEFVSQRVVLDDEDRGAQDAESVLARGHGRCSGRANAAVGLLREVGIPARVVHGVVVGERGVKWHRWGEAWLDRLGWVSFDPGVAVGIVSVRYVPMRGAAEGAPLSGIRILGIDEQGYVGVPVRNGLRVLPSQGVTVQCLAGAPASEMWAALYSPDGSRWVRRGHGEVVFSGLLPGRYRLVWPQRDRLREAELTLGAAGIVRLDLHQVGEVGS